MESLQKRIASVLTQRSEQKRKAQFDAKKREEPKVDPSAKMLDQIYEALSDDDSSSALDTLYKLTNHLKLADDVSFDVPEEHKEDEKGMTGNKPFKHREHNDDHDDSKAPEEEDRFAQDEMTQE